MLHSWDTVLRRWNFQFQPQCWVNNAVNRSVETLVLYCYSEVKHTCDKVCHYKERIILLLLFVLYEGLSSSVNIT